MTTTDIILFVLVVVASIIGISIGRGIRRQVDSARIEDDGRLRELSVDERIVVASHLARQRGRWFWPLLLGGAAAVLVCGAILWRLGYIGH